MPLKLDAWDIAAQVRLERQNHKGSFLLVEGANDDRVLSRFSHEQHCSIVVAFGKPNVVGALNLLEEEGFPGTLGMIDADFDRIMAKTYSCENIIISQNHDVDADIFFSSAFDVFIRERAEPERLRQFLSAKGGDLRAAIMSSASQIACARLLSEQQTLKLKFVDLNFSNFISVDDLSCDIATLVHDLINNSPGTGITEPELLKKLKIAISKGYDPRQLCCGHDLMGILGIALRKCIGTNRDVHTWRSEIELGMRLAFDREAFEATAIYRAAKKWEAETPPYKILRF